MPSGIAKLIEIAHWLARLVKCQCQYEHRGLRSVWGLAIDGPWPGWNWAVESARESHNNSPWRMREFAEYDYYCENSSDDDDWYEEYDDDDF